MRTPGGSSLGSRSATEKSRPTVTTGSLNDGTRAHAVNLRRDRRVFLEEHLAGGSGLQADDGLRRGCPHALQGKAVEAGKLGERRRTSRVGRPQEREILDPRGAQKRHA